MKQRGRKKGWGLGGLGPGLGFKGCLPVSETQPTPWQCVSVEATYQVNLPDKVGMRSALQETPMLDPRVCIQSPSGCATCGLKLDIFIRRSGTLKALSAIDLDCHSTSPSHLMCSMLTVDDQHPNTNALLGFRSIGCYSSFSMLSR